MTSGASIVVVAAVVERDGCFLLTLRPRGTHLEGLWEFPGGKCEPGETHADALVREHAIAEYGQAIRDLAAVNIFAGDLLYKNFGQTRYGRVVFYDYDEIEYMTDCSFRKIPAPPPGFDDCSGEVWYRVGPKDVFPEEFATFLLTDPDVRDAFLRHHADLLAQLKRQL